MKHGFAAIQLSGIQGLAYGGSWLQGIWHVIFSSFLMCKEKGHNWESRSSKYLSCILARGLCNSARFLSMQQPTEDLSLRKTGRLAQYLRQHTGPTKGSTRALLVLQLLACKLGLFPIPPTNLLFSHCLCFSGNLAAHTLLLTTCQQTAKGGHGHGWDPNHPLLSNRHLPATRSTPLQCWARDLLSCTQKNKDLTLCFLFASYEPSVGKCCFIWIHHCLFIISL